MAHGPHCPQAGAHKPSAALPPPHCSSTTAASTLGRASGQRPKAGGRRTPSCLSGPGRRAPPPGKAEVTSHRPPPLPHKAKPPPHAHLAPSASLGTPLAVLRARGQRLGGAGRPAASMGPGAGRLHRQTPLPPPRPHMPRTRPNGHLTPTWRRVSAWEYPWPCLGPGGKGGGSSPAPSPVMCVRWGCGYFIFFGRNFVLFYANCFTYLSFIIARGRHLKRQRCWL